MKVHLVMILAAGALFAGLASLIGCAHDRTSSDYAMLAELCKAQCPTARILALRGCDEISADSPLRTVCIEQAEQVFKICPTLCDRIRTEVPKEPTEPGSEPDAEGVTGAPEPEGGIEL